VTGSDPAVWPADDRAAGLTVSTGGPAVATALERHLPALVADKIASRIAGGDPTLWGDAAVSEASIRLGWVGLPDTSRPLVEPIAELRAALLAEGVDRVVLCGMGGSSLAPEVITAAAGVDLVVLDGTDPAMVRATLVDLERTVVVVSSKSGSTVETDSQRRTFEAAFTAAGIVAKDRIVVVTDPGSPLEKAATEAGYRAVFSADPTVGGRFSALTAFGLVPSGLAGADVGDLLDEAAAVGDLLAEDSDANPALVLGALLGGTPGGSAGHSHRDKIVFTDLDSDLPGFGDWAEQLIAESTGKEGTGLLPVVVSSPEAPEVRWPADDVIVVRLLPTDEDPPETGDDVAPEDAGATSASSTAPVSVSVSGSLGAQIMLWEYAVSIAGRLLSINPFDQPDVESAKKAARGLLDAQPGPEPADAVDGAVEIRATPGLLNGASTVDAAVDALLAAVPSRGYLAVMAYLDRLGEAALADVRDPLARRTERPVTFGWGPRFLHSTGQFHKGGPPIGAYLQITGASAEDLPIPDSPFTFGVLIAAQAAGDAKVLADHGRPVLRLHLTDRAAGLAQVIASLNRSTSLD
jgi:glucose-6-phosphate isomerase